MTALAGVIAVLVGSASSELLLRSLRAGAWLPRRLRATLNILRELEAGDDRQRQSSLIRAGVSTIALGVSVLGVLALIAALFALPTMILEWDAKQETLYALVATGAAIAWWILRAVLGSS
jgi:hypothetical protein